MREASRRDPRIVRHWQEGEVCAVGRCRDEAPAHDGCAIGAAGKGPAGWGRVNHPFDEDFRLINNRQGGRRRGRGGGGGGGGGGRAPGAGPSMGNRQDNRQRGNAAQLLEKYRGLARDAQMAGDRVQSEYYLQFADHYFRVLNENRARFEEHRRQRGDEYGDEDEGDEDQMQQADEASYDDGAPERAERQDRPQRDRGERHARGDRPERSERSDRGDRQDRAERPERAERAERQDRPERAQRTPRADAEQEGGERVRRPRTRRRFEEGQDGETVTAANDAEAGGERIALESLPPAIGIAPSSDEDEAPKPVRRRTRRPRGEAEDIAPAA